MASTAPTPGSPASAAPSPLLQSAPPPPPQPDTPAPSAPSSPPLLVTPVPPPPPVSSLPFPPSAPPTPPPPDTPAPSAPSSPPPLVTPSPPPPPVSSLPFPPSAPPPPQPPDTPAPSAPSSPPPLVSPAPSTPPVSSFPSPQSEPLPGSSISRPSPPVTPAPSSLPSPPTPVAPPPSPPPSPPTPDAPSPSPPPSPPVSTSPSPSPIRSSPPPPPNFPPPPPPVPTESSQPPHSSTAPRSSANPSPPPPSLPTAESPVSSPPSPAPKNSYSPSSYQPAPPPPNSSVSPPSTQVIRTPPSKNGTGNSTSPTPAAAENSSSAGSGGISSALAATIGVVAGLLVLGLIVIVLFLKMRRKKVSHLSGVYVMPTSRGSSGVTAGGSSGSDFVSVPPELGGGLRNSRQWFTYEELSTATDGFSAQNFLGQGGFGSVYKGNLVDGREVAVKQLKVGGGQGEREFRAEVEIISRIHHRHLVSLVGYCFSESRRLLVYDYVPNNTLYFHLHGKGREVMDWATRVKVAAGAAHGIAYLHEDCRPRVIHRDIKSSNILLDNNFEARVSDFGLAKLDFDANTHISTRVMGTFGYMAPEYATSGKLTEKSDVYSLGVVILELITGRKPVDTSQPLGDESLVEWARPLLSRVLENDGFDILVDPRLEQNYDQCEMIQMIEAAAACVRHSAIKRPRMGQVVRALDSITGADLANGMRLGESEMDTSALQSNEIKLFQRMAFGSHGYTSEFLIHSSLSQGVLNSR